MLASLSVTFLLVARTRTPLFVLHRASSPFRSSSTDVPLSRELDESVTKLNCETRYASAVAQ